MYTSPWQTFFIYLFYLVYALVSVVLNIVAARIVNQTKWRIHLRWIVPSIFASVLQLVYQGGSAIAYFIGITLSPFLHQLIIGLSCVTGIIAIYVGVMVCRTLRQIVNETQTPPTAPPADPGVWPPPPTPPA